MAYPSNYFPATYTPYVPSYTSPVSAQAATPVAPQMATPVAPGTNSMIWVQGESGAKSYIVTPNSTVMLMDSEQDRFYIKSADASGMPSPLRVFEYTELTSRPAPEPAPVATYVTREEFDAFKAEMKSKPSTRKVKDEQSV